MPVTLKDIAKKSGFSVTQVSRALAGYDDVSERTRAHIKRIANELGYQPNFAGRQLQSQRTNTIGIIIPTPPASNYDDFFTLLLRGITYEAAISGYDVLVSAASPEKSEIDIYRRIVGGKRVDGIVLARTQRNDKRIQYLQGVGCPFIVHGRSAPDEASDFSYIDVDSQHGIALLTGHLIKQGYQHIGIILPPEQLAFTPYRLAGYKSTIEKYGLPFLDQHCVHGDMTLEGGAEAAEKLLTQRPELDAIIGCNDWMAHGAASTIKKHGYSIGKDFAVVGYDDIPVSAHMEPPLTTIHQPIYNIGKELIRELIQQIASKDDPTVGLSQRLIEPQLIVRASSGRAP